MAIEATALLQLRAKPEQGAAKAERGELPDGDENVRHDPAPASGLATEF